MGRRQSAARARFIIEMPEGRAGESENYVDCAASLRDAASWFVIPERKTKAGREDLRRSPNCTLGRQSRR